MFNKTLINFISILNYFTFIIGAGLWPDFYTRGGQAVDKGGQAKFSKYFSLVENHIKLVLRFEKEIILQINTKNGKFVKNFKQKFEKKLKNFS